MQRALPVLLCLICFASGSGVVYSQESDPDLLMVDEINWGFDGRVTLQEFVPLWVEVKNISATPWQGTLQLSRKVRGERQFGATIEQEVVLQGDETRWVQFTPYVIDDLEDWEIRWAQGEDYVVDLPPVLKGEPATVLIYDSDAVRQETTVFKRMSEERFPTSVTGTDSLRGIILNKAPFWQGARARACQDWLLLGGRVYILHNEDDEFPVFPNSLSFLNSQQNRFRVGSGEVIKIPRKVDDFSISDARSEIFNNDWSVEDQKAQEEFKKSQQTGYNSLYSYYSLMWSKNGDLFRDLVELANYKRYWSVIYLAVFAYLATLWPGCYIIGTQQKKVTLFYAAFFSSAVFFAGTFSLLGQVGGRAENRIRSVVLAEYLDEGSLNLTSWSVLANIYEGEKTISHPGSGTQYSTTQETEMVRGALHPGTGGSATFNMLPDSKRTVLQRGRIRTTFAKPELLSLAGESTKMQSLSFNIEGVFEEAPLSAIAIVSGVVYELDHKGNVLSHDQRKKPLPLTNYLMQTDRLNNAVLIWGQPVKNEEEEEDETLVGMERYIPFMRAIVGNSFGLVNELDLRKLGPSREELQLFVMLPTPEPLKVVTEDFPDQEGVTVFKYCYQP